MSCRGAGKRSERICQGSANGVTTSGHQGFCGDENSRGLRDRKDRQCVPAIRPETAPTHARVRPHLRSLNRGLSTAPARPLVHQQLATLSPWPISLPFKPQPICHPQIGVWTLNVGGGVSDALTWAVGGWCGAICCRARRSITVTSKSKSTKDASPVRAVPFSGPGGQAPNISHLH